MLWDVEQGAAPPMAGGCEWPLARAALTTDAGVIYAGAYRPSELFPALV